MQKIVLGLIEKVDLNGVSFSAKIDTGADRSSVCSSLVDKLHLKSTGKKAKINSASGTSIRPIVSGELIIKAKKFNAEFTVADRDQVKYDVLIGKDILKKGFLVDPSK